MKPYGTYFLIYIKITDPSTANLFGESSGIDLHLKKVIVNNFTFVKQEIN